MKHTSGGVGEHLSVVSRSDSFLLGPPSPSKIGIITSTNCCAEVDTSSGDSGGGGGGAKVGNGGGLSNGVQKRNLFLDANKMAPVSSQEGLDAVVNSSTVRTTLFVAFASCLYRTVLHSFKKCPG